MRFTSEIEVDVERVVVQTPQGKVLWEKTSPKSHVYELININREIVPSQHYKSLHEMREYVRDFEKGNTHKIWFQKGSLNITLKKPQPIKHNKCAGDCVKCVVLRGAAQALKVIECPIISH
jgi:hypothetical protein